MGNNRSLIIASGISTSIFRPLFLFDLGVVPDTYYYVYGVLSGDISQVSKVKLRSSPVLNFDSGTGIFSGITKSASTIYNEFLIETNGTSTFSIAIDSFSLKEIGLPVFKQDDLGDQPTLRVNGDLITAEFTDGQSISASFPAGKLTSDSSIITVLNTSDILGILFSDQDAGKYAISWEQGSTSTDINSGIGAATVWIDGIQFIGTRGELYTLIADGNDHLIELRNAALNLWDVFGISAYAFWEFDGTINNNTIVVPTSQFLADNRAAIYNAVGQGSEVSF